MFATEFICDKYLRDINCGAKEIHCTGRYN